MSAARFSHQFSLDDPSIADGKRFVNRESERRFIAMGSDARGQRCTQSCSKKGRQNISAPQAEVAEPLSSSVQRQQNKKAARLRPRLLSECEQQKSKNQRA